ncbi:AI-2E family transporter [Oceanirhabdus sp. W0125-5]|uniref:AI-2E family transporter n=1 Tax=Oceanirhabdus sp. W0125-5 TaxID=2999116 RepID=UPI0022F3077C|nr:AI-2E family transporter [Oceanirhabdus sp. W0125-5]WBW99555.1 AI-2E family transporter [Oceanirhabdus sp. W0125-5]
MLENKFFRISLKIISVLVIILLLIRVSPILTPLYNVMNLFLIPLIFAVFLYYVLRPVVNLVEKWTKKRGLSVGITFVGVIILFGIMFGYGGTQIGKELVNLFNALKKVIEGIISNKIEVWPFEQYIPLQDLIDKTAEYFEGILGNLASEVASSATGVVSAIGNIGTKIFLTLFMLVFFLKDGSLIMDKIVGLIPVKHRETVGRIRNKVDETLAVYISGQITVSLILGLLTLIGYSIIKLPNAFALSFINLIFNLIPYVGPIIGFIPALIMSLSGGPTLILMVIIVAIVVQQLEGNFISPWVIGDKLKIHPLTVVIVITASISQLGIIGAFAAIPVYAIIRVIMKEVKLKKKDKLIDIEQK